MSRFMDATDELPIIGELDENDPSCEHPVYEGGRLDPEHGQSEFTALFEHVGIADRTDWKAVAIGLARLYRPELLPCIPSAGRKQAGRPEIWDALREATVFHVCCELMRASREGRILRRDLDLTAACHFLTDATPEAGEWRRRGSIPEGMTMENLRNRLSGIASRRGFSWKSLDYKNESRK